MLPYIDILLRCYLTHIPHYDVTLRIYGITMLPYTDIVLRCRIALISKYNVV